MQLVLEFVSQCSLRAREYHTMYILCRVRTVDAPSLHYFVDHMYMFISFDRSILFLFPENKWAKFNSCTSQASFVQMRIRGTL